MGLLLTLSGLCKHLNYLVDKDRSPPKYDGETGNYMSKRMIMSEAEEVDFINHLPIFERRGYLEV